MNCIEIEFIRKLRAFRKDDRTQEIISNTSKTEGLIHIFSVIEQCNTYKPWHDKTTGKTFLKFDQSKCLHYYFYFIDKELGLCYLRAPTWAPFRLQFCMNDHNLLVHKLQKKNIEYRMHDNTFLEISDVETAQKLSDSYIHRSQYSFDTGAELNLLTNYIYISLDTFHSVVQNISSHLEAWLAFLSSDEPGNIIQLVESYPEFREYYHDITMFRRKPKELMNMFSEALLQMDRNTANYMIEELAKEYEIKLAQKDTVIAEKDAAISEKDAYISEKDAYIKELEARLAKQNQP